MSQWKLQINDLKKIDDIVQELRSSFSYSTQLRNVAYLIQLDEFLSQLTGHLDKGMKVVYKHNLLRMRADILEGLLYCSLKDIDKLPKPHNRKKPGLQAYANKAKGVGIISTNTHKQIAKICTGRDNFHPPKQEVLFTNEAVSDPIFRISDSILNITLANIKKYFEKIHATI